MYTVFTKRMAQIFPVSRQLMISRRGLRQPDYRVARYNLWKEPVNPWKEQHRLPVHSGGLLAELLYGDPRTEILKWVQEKGCDLIAMSTHGHRFIGDLILGTTASHVQHRVDVPVLLVRARGHKSA